MKRAVLKSIDESIRTKERLKLQASKILELASMAVAALREGGKIVLFGNGGSAADAQHIAAEFVGRYQISRRSLPALALSTNTSVLTAVSNDWGYRHVFKRQVEGLCTSKDLVIGISTSGNSENVLLGIREAKVKGAKTACLTGRSGGKLAKLVDLAIRVPSDSTPRIQESHILIGHILSDLVEQQIAGPISRDPV